VREVDFGSLTDQVGKDAYRPVAVIKCRFPNQT